MVVSSLLAMFMGAVYESVIVGLRVADTANDRSNLHWQLAKALDQLTREASVASNVDAAEDQRFQMDGDIDGDGNNESNINFRVQSGDLQRVYSGDTVTVVPDLTSLDFDYLDLNNAAMATPVASGSRNDIRVIQITMTATRDNETVSLTAAAFLRNND